MHITLIYAAILALFFVGLSWRTLRMRRRLRIPVGDGGNEAMLRAMRVHANFAEYVPFTLLLLYLAEASGAGSLFMHALGLSTVVGRVVHAIGVSRVRENYAYRVTGMVLTLAPMVAAAIRLLQVAVSAGA